MYVGGKTAAVSSAESFGLADISPSDCCRALVNRPEQIQARHFMKPSTTGIFSQGQFHVNLHFGRLLLASCII
jgi:hypothetical protein